ncbi:type 1 glutamine amidotransferase domain-containing protein [Sphingomonas sp. LY160]|uniref:type 1 glutamine amidotransferase domain-containing protein n=1 Tax=Sphingomonas sp. LY160 TaxID=3095342 RepID=UPI002ADEFC11|nr:type 1 glutamine amidotransferase domain-containing protein [Sphingomonas sp. LY160]MEA1073007.1 type 1 glutamine amidotransferase domain-containing protein [Sphingomonas sp. LY160]
MPKIADAKVLIIATNRFEESELFGPRERLLEKGAEVTLASLDTEEIMGTVHDEPGKTIKPDLTISDVNADDYDALLLPGGVGNPDRLRMEDGAIALVKAFDQAGKPVAAICHGPWLLAEADILRGRTATSWPSIRTDLRNAGANVVDKEAVTDGNLVTSRNPDDVPAFTDALIAAIEER